MPAQNVTRKLIEAHLASGEMTPGEEIGLKVDQTLTQDATGTLVMLELEAMGFGRVQTELSAQYVDHNLIQADNRNPDDHLFLHSACQKYGIHYSPPGSGISHAVHMERFGQPGKTLLGADSHTCAAGSLGMLAIGAGGLAVALAMAGEPFYLQMPKVLGVKLTGDLPEWVSAKDVILEMLRRHGVSGGVGYVIEYHGPGLRHLSAMDRHVIANMGAELGATTTVFPADENVAQFLEMQRRAEGFVPLEADEDAGYDESDEIALDELQPLIALPGSPGNVTTVREVSGRPIYQAYIGSSANPGLRDMAVPAEMLGGRQVHEQVSLDINPASRQVLENLSHSGWLSDLLHAGARLHQAGCNGCIGMGQAPATDRISLRTVPRNFPGRSGTPDDLIYLCSPETATASAVMGEITDPRDFEGEYPRIDGGKVQYFNDPNIRPPRRDDDLVALEKGPNIVELPEFETLPDELEMPVLLKLGDDVSTDAIMPAGARVLPFRSNVAELSRFVFQAIDNQYPDRALECRDTGSALVGGSNYGQGSSREHAALAPRYLGVRCVIARSFSRIHWENLCNFGILPLEFEREADYDSIEQDDTLNMSDLRAQLRSGVSVKVLNRDKQETYTMTHRLSRRQVELVLKGGVLNVMHERLKAREQDGA